LPETFLTSSGIYSAIFGAIFGLIIAPILKRPSSWFGFGVLLAATISIPVAAATVMIPRVNIPFFAHLSLFLFTFLAVISIGFVIRQISRRKVDTSHGAAGEPAA